MSKRQLPAVQAFVGRAGLGFETPPNAAERWTPGVRAADTEADNIISVLDVIGEDFWTGDGVTPKRVAAALRKIGERDVEVHINSPGGDMFDGIAIYNQLREHPHKVTVKVLGLAASAASVIAMAGDEIQIGRAGFFMIHNAWGVVAGDRHFMREIADMFEPFDAAMADVYAARTGMDASEIAAMMDRETWIGGSEAVEKGFADSLLPSSAITEAGDVEARAAALAAYRVDALLARSGVARGKRRELIREISSGTPGAAATGMPGAAEDAMPGAGVTANPNLSDALATLKGIQIPTFEV